MGQSYLESELCGWGNSRDGYTLSRPPGPGGAALFIIPRAPPGWDPLPKKKKKKKLVLRNGVSLAISIKHTPGQDPYSGVDWYTMNFKFFVLRTFCSILFVFFFSLMFLFFGLIFIFRFFCDFFHWIFCSLLYTNHGFPSHSSSSSSPDPYPFNSFPSLFFSFSLGNKPKANNPDGNKEK